MVYGVNKIYQIRQRPRAEWTAPIQDIEFPENSGNSLSVEVDDQLYDTNSYIIIQSVAQVRGAQRVILAAAFADGGVPMKVEIFFWREIPTPIPLPLEL